MASRVRIGVAVLIAVVGTTVATVIATGHGTAGRVVAVGVTASVLGLWLSTTADS
jgi:hypothetical protein